ncbi:MAG: PaaX family transcriptional regulator C-terminal domain-containing protein [Marmoricola sp.]
MSRSVARVLAPLPARSVVLSLMLGAHPDRMRTAEIIAAGEYFGISASTMRVALSRASSAGDLRRVEGGYELSDRLRARQRHQDEGVEDIGASWDGTWEMAVVVVAGRSGADRAALRDGLHAARLAELREGVWMRPSNLRRPRDYEQDPVLDCFTVEAREDAADLAARLWDLKAWAIHGEDLLDDLSNVKDPALRLAVAANVVRLLTADPLLPPSLVPEGWPGEHLRQAYRAYQVELRGLAGLGS